MHKILLALAFTLVCTYNLSAQSSSPAGVPELETDRPTQAQGATVVPQATVQIETGFQYEKDIHDDINQQQFLYPTTLIRIGVLKNAELRINADYERDKQKHLNGSAVGVTDIQSGFDHVQVGTKVTLYEGTGVVSTVGVLGMVTLPVGNKEFRPPHAAPEMRVLLESELSEKIKLNYNLSYRKEQEQEEFQSQGLYTITGTWQVTDKLTWFAEVFGQKAIKATAEHQVDTGLMFKLAPNFQVDIIGGLQLNQAAPDAFAGSGITWRLPR